MFHLKKNKKIFNCIDELIYIICAVFLNIWLAYDVFRFKMKTFLEFPSTMQLNEVNFELNFTYMTDQLLSKSFYIWKKALFILLKVLL